MPKTSLREFKTLAPYLSRYRRQYVFGFICLIVVDAAQMIIPQFMRRAVDLISSGSFKWSEVLILSACMVGVMAVIALGRFLWRFFLNGASRRIEAEMRRDLFDRLMTLSYDFYQQHMIGDLMARATNDLNAVRMSIGFGLVALVDGTVMASVILAIIFIQDAGTAAWAVIPLPLITALILCFGRVVGKRFRRAQETYSKMSDTVQETFAGIRVVKSFVKEWWFIKKFAGANDDYREANMILVKLYGAFFPLISFLSGITTLSALLAGGSRVIAGYMSPGDLVALFRYLQMLIWPIMGAGFMVNMIQRGAVSLARVNEVMNTVPAILSPPRPAALPRKDLDRIAAVEIRSLTFAYPGGNPVLEDINLTVKQGTVVGILGRTGSGKSTLIKALTRMIDPPGGTVFIKGVDVSAWDLSALRGLFGVALQDSYLFSDTIKNNIAYGMENPDMAFIAKAAGLAALDKDLKTFNHGWDTLIGERGLTLSGGQKQRAAMARALIGEPEFLILDDAFSAVDAETEKRILEGLMRERKVSGGRKTTVIISHRVSTLRGADLVIVLDKGRIIEQGSPLELTRGTGFFARMAVLQRLGEDEARV
jgi:ATP-binding cassette subfamily B protein